MPTRNRGKQTTDDTYFNATWQSILKEAVDDMCYLLSRGYADSAALSLVGNHYKLNKRQRDAILRVSASQKDIDNRLKTECQLSDLSKKTLEIDGFNLLILLESALSGAYVFKARDGLYRDISSVHGTYKRVEKTEKAIYIVGETLQSFNLASIKWYFDQPVSNSGRLKTRMLEISREQGWNWEIELVYNPDKVLAESKNIVVSSDAWILNAAEKWFNLGAFIIEKELFDATIL